MLREARERADAILAELLTHQVDGDAGLGRVAGKLAGYRAAAIKSQEVVREGDVDFAGLLTGPAGRARFAMNLVRQQDGRWAVATFSGPDPESGRP